MCYSTVEYNVILANTMIISRLHEYSHEDYKHDYTKAYGNEADMQSAQFTRKGGRIVIIIIEKKIMKDLRSMYI